MKFSIQREAFLKPLRAVQGVAEKRHNHTAPILSHVLIDACDQTLSLTTTDQEIEIIAKATLEAPVPTPWRITVPFRKLMDICKALPEGAIVEVFAADNNRVVIRSGRSRVSLSSLSAEAFPNLEQVSGEKITIPKAEFRTLIETTGFAMAEQDVRYYLNGLLLELKQQTLSAVGADGHRLALNTLSLGSLDFPAQNTALSPLRIIVPRKGVFELQRVLEDVGDEFSLIISGNHLRLEAESLTLTTKLLEGRFPEYERIIPSGGERVLLGNRELLKAAFHRASTLFMDKFRGVRLFLTKGCLKILAINTEQDEVEEDVEVEYTGEELDIGFNVKYLLDILTVLQSKTVRFTFSDANSSAKIEACEDNNNMVYVIMPMKI